MEHLKEYIHSKRPNLSNSSLITYTSILKNLYHKVFGKVDVDFKKYDDTESILHFLRDMPPNRRKTILSALVIITDKKEYRDLMLDDVRDYNKEILKQKKTPEQEASWVSGNEVKDIWDDLKRNADLIYKKKTLTPHDLQQIQSYIIMSLLGGIFIPPRRSKDYVDFVIKDIDKNKNYMEKNKLFFNSYKTAKTYGCQVIDIPKPLQNILKKWITINPTKTLLFDINMNPLSSVKLNQRINKIFSDKKVSVNALRHSYLTDKYATHSQVDKELSKDMTEMGSSRGMADTYIKL